MKSLKYLVILLLVLAPTVGAQPYVFRIMVAYSLDYLDSNTVNPLLPVQNCVAWANSVFEEYPDDMLGQVSMELVMHTGAITGKILMCSWIEEE